MVPDFEKHRGAEAKGAGREGGVSDGTKLLVTLIRCKGSATWSQKIINFQGIHHITESHGLSVFHQIIVDISEKALQVRQEEK